MAVNRSDLRTAIRSKLGAFPEFTTTINGAITATATSVVLTAATNLTARMLMEIETEILRTISLSSLTATVMRGDKGSTAAAHTNLTAISFYPQWGWTNIDLNRLITKAINWLGEGMCWTLVPKTITWLADFKEFGLPSGAVYPTGNIVKRIEMEDSSGFFHEIAGWRHMGDRIILNRKLYENKDVRIWLQQKQGGISDDSTQLDEDKWAEVIELYSTSEALDELLAQRSRYLEYSATLNDRASSADELQRLSYSFLNKATMLRDQYSRPGLAGFAPIIRPGGYPNQNLNNTPGIP